jgi:hypothetical protein
MLARPSVPASRLTPLRTRTRSASPQQTSPTPARMRRCLAGRGPRPAPPATWPARQPLRGTARLPAAVRPRRTAPARLSRQPPSAAPPRRLPRRRRRRHAAAAPPATSRRFAARGAAPPAATGSGLARLAHPTPGSGPAAAAQLGCWVRAQRKTWVRAPQAALPTLAPPPTRLATPAALSAARGCPPCCQRLRPPDHRDRAARPHPQARGLQLGESPAPLQLHPLQPALSLRAQPSARGYTRPAYKEHLHGALGYDAQTKTRNTAGAMVDTAAALAAG